MKHLSRLLFAAALLAAPLAAQDDDPEALPLPLPDLVTQVHAWAEAHPDLVAPLRARIDTMVRDENFDLAAAEARVHEWLELHAPQIARIRAMGRPGADEEQIVESLELRRTMLLELTEPVVAKLEATDGPLDRLGAMLRELRASLGGPLSLGDEAPAEEGELRIELAVPEGAAPVPPAEDSLAARARRLFGALRERLGGSPAP